MLGNVQLAALNWGRLLVGRIISTITAVPTRRLCSVSALPGLADDSLSVNQEATLTKPAVLATGHLGSRS